MAVWKGFLLLPALLLFAVEHAVLDIGGDVLLLQHFVVLLGAVARIGHNGLWHPVVLLLELADGGRVMVSVSVGS